MAANIDDTMPPPPTSAASGCPVLARGGVDADPSPAAKPGIWNRWFSPTIAPTTTTTTTMTTMTTTTTTVDQCPVVGRGSESAVGTQPPASIEEAARHSQFPAPGQRAILSTRRVVSSIPRGDDDAHDAPSSPPAAAEDGSSSSSTSTSAVPSHQPPNSGRWQYPSEQQFYNAMLRKGYRPPVESIPSVLRIHNAVNERSWHQVRRWEKEVHDNAEPRLVKFVGRPKDLSPRAWFNSRVLMTGEPFDRHDWYVEDANGGEPRRYVIDFYEGKEGGPGGGVGVADRMSMANKPPSMYIDVRPALDGPSAAVDRMTMFAREALPGLASAWDAYGKSSSSSSSSSSPAASSTSSSSGGGVRVAGMEDGAGAGEVDGIRKR